MWAVGALGCPVNAEATTTSSTTTPPVINGSFVQPPLIDGFTDAQLAAEDGYLTRAGLTQQVLQWTADSQADTAIFPSGLAGYTQNTNTDVLGRALSAADAAGLTEFVGLQTNNNWWTNYANNTNWLTGQATLANQLADTIWSNYGSHSSFGGWYLPFEVDNWNFTTQASWTAMANFYQTVASHLHTLTPGLPVIIAPFFNTSGGQTSQQWTTMWTSILKNSPIDVIALQDGIGDGHATTAQLSTWYAATASAISAAGAKTKLWADVETYTPSFQPMDIATIVADMDQEQNYVSNFLSFSYDHYLSPQQVAPAYDTTYRAYASTGTVETTPPSMPTNLTAKTVATLSIEISWTASTDNTGVAGYQIYRDGALVATVGATATAFTDSGLQPSTSYSYAVSAFDAAGNISATSQTASATTSALPPSPVNFAAGASYTASLAADSSYPDSGGELTDGTLGTTSYTDPAWQGRNTGTPYSFTIDLGTAQTVNEVDSDWLQVQSVSIFLPSKLTIGASTDGSTFTTIGTVNAPAVSTADQSVMYRLFGLNVTARYIQVSVTPASSAWSFTDELAVKGGA